ncbi:hephaestin-like protein [Sinocyclocheilus anshuiensis]|uniref:hephaestin-like protein n=1 Tax=Sinocyclocheilus anshuiensis TaxID=1608454 RepID=UPI0007B989E7|nr:PREDICTED: hephaestin-like protein [Sinocyclocheilus anshuiensis]
MVQNLFILIPCTPEQTVSTWSFIVRYETPLLGPCAVWPFWHSCVIVPQLWRDTITLQLLILTGTTHLLDSTGLGRHIKKVVYREYNEGFTQAKPHPLSSGQEGDTIIVTFKNMADHPCSIHPHGIAYGKQSEGSLYFDNTSLYEKEDDVILPSQEHTFQ